MKTDRELLDAYRHNRDQDAFTQLVQRHGDMVYGAARRMLGSHSHEAEDIMQAVFLLLARKAHRIHTNHSLATWLFNATRLCCANLRRTEGRRKRRELETAMQPREHLSENLAPFLDEILSQLSRKEREVILIRYFENKTAAETAHALNLSPAAVEKRLSRGIAHLRTLFAQRGHALPIAAIVASLAAEHALSAPAQSITRAATLATPGAGSAAVQSMTRELALMMLKTKIKWTLAAIACALFLAGAAVVLWNSFHAPVASIQKNASPPADTSPLVTDGLTVSGDVVDDKGNPAPNIIVGLPPGTGFGVPTDAAGHFTISGAAKYLPSTPQSYLFARDTTRNLAACIPIPHSLDHLHVALAPAMHFRGRCVDADGNPIESARLTLVLCPEPASHLDWGNAGFADDRTFTDADGRFDFPALPFFPDFHYILWANRGKTQFTTSEQFPHTSVRPDCDLGDITILPKSNP